MGYTNLLTEKSGGILVVTVNRPNVHNALNLETCRELRSLIEEVRVDPEVMVVIITGAGQKSFVSGGDVNYLKQRSLVETLAGEIQAVISALEGLEKPVIAAVNGYAIGGGCELAMACDIRIASDNAFFGQPELGLGILPGAGGTQRLPRLVGLGRAKELIFTGRIIDAHEAERIGLVNKVVPQAELLPTAKNLAEKIMAKGPLAVRVAKMVMNAGFSVDLNTALMLERLGQTVLFGSEDRLEGLTAFLEKRSPRFLGR